jgi:protein TonB
VSAVTADLFDQWTITGARRWLASLAVVVALHIAVALIILFRQVPMAPVSPPQPPILMDLAPLPAAPMNLHPLPAQPLSAQPLPATPPQSQPSQQAQPQVQTQTQPQVQPQTPPVSPPTPPAPQPETTSPLLPSATEATEPRIIVPPPPEIAEPPAPAKPAVKNPPVQTASVPSVPALPMPDAQETSLSAWQRKVIARLYSLNRLPPGMPAAEATATADVMISVNRQGHIVYFRIVRPSGYPTLDHAVRSLMRHADPLPPPPPPPIDLYDQPQSFVLTIGYYSVPVN